MLFNMYGMYALYGAVDEFLGVDTYAPFFEHVESVFTGEKTFAEALSGIRVSNSSRYNFVESLREFDLSIFLSESFGYPDPMELRETPFVIDQAVPLRPLAIEAWNTLKTGEYIPGLFSLSILITIFLSPYPDDTVDTIDFSTVEEAYTMLKRGIIGMSLGEEYAKTRHR